MDQTMYANPLSAPLIIKDYVKGEEKCNYENYLIELLNKSSWFSKKYPGVFVSPSSESHGECDAFNNHYQIDFKLFAAKTLLQGRSLLDQQVAKIQECFIVHSGCRSVGNSINATQLFVAFRGKTLDDLYRIRSNNCKQYGIENDVLSALKILETKKNILLFFPYIFSFNIYHNFSAGIKSIQEALNSDFSVAFAYRKKRAPANGTFWTCMYENSFLVFSVVDEQLLFCDSVATKELPTYKLLERYTKWC